MSHASDTVERPTLSGPGASRPVCFVAWGAVAGRSQEIARSIGAEARCFFAPRSRRRPPAVLRYPLCALGTVFFLMVRRPRVVIVTNPPILAALVAYGCARVLGAALILDSHPGGFGAQGDRVAARLQPVHRYLVARAALVLVTEEDWAEVVRSWAGTPAVLHEAPPGWEARPPVRHDRLSILVVGRMAADEPVAEVLEAARVLEGCDVVMTGDPASCPAPLRAGAPKNVSFVGFLDHAAYRVALEEADIVLTLTTEPTSVMRAAYEAVYVGRPLVVSDWPLARALFGWAGYARNEASSIATALDAMAADYDRAVASIGEARRVQLERWAAQRDVLIEAIEATSNGSGEELSRSSVGAHHDTP